jgi:hypothetical protein
MTFKLLKKSIKIVGGSVSLMDNQLLQLQLESMTKIIFLMVFSMSNLNTEARVTGRKFFKKHLKISPRLISESHAYLVRFKRYTEIEGLRLTIQYLNILF